MRLLLDDAGQDIQEQARSTTASRVTGRDYFPYRIMAMQTKLKGQSQKTCKLCVDSAKHQTRKVYNSALLEAWYRALFGGLL
jgi:hypothetical protein